VLQQLGKGKYGEVFEGIDLDAGASCVVKIMRPVKEQRLKREIKILRHVRGGPNIVTLVDLVRDPDTKTPCFVFEMVDALPLRELQVCCWVFWGRCGGFVSGVGVVLVRRQPLPIYNLPTRVPLLAPNQTQRGVSRQTPPTTHPPGRGD
jgi:hypothetical protein